MAEQGLGDSGVEGGVADVQARRVTGAELGAVGCAVGLRMLPGHLDQVRAEVDAKDASLEPRATQDGPIADAGAAAPVDDAVGLIDAHGVEALV